MTTDTSSSEMKVFISWSGERSQSLAQALHDWIPLVLHNITPWLSNADIEAGDRWAEAVTKELADSNFGIICVTRENVDSPWVLFEAGALAKSMQGSKVVPLLLDLDIRDITGPLAQFQAKKVDKAGISEVIHSMNSTANLAVPEARAKQLFDALWPEFEKKVSIIPKQPAQVKHARPTSEILEELVTSVRSLDSRFRDISEGMPISLRNRRMRYHPMMVREITHMIAEKPGDPIALLILASMLHDDFPWLYELGMAAYRTANSGTPDEAERAKRQFRRAVEITGHGPFDEMGLDPRMLSMLVRELDHSMMTDSTKDDELRPRAIRGKKRDKDDDV